MKRTLVWITPALALCLMVGSRTGVAQSGDVKVQAPVIVAKSGKHCKDDPNCFNRIHYAIKPVARVTPGQQFVLETRDGLDSEFDLQFDKRGCGCH